MSFEAYGATQNQGTQKPAFDFEKLNNYVVETAQLEQRETLVGVVSAIIDLGLQERTDAEVVFTGTEEDERKRIADKPQTYFKDGKDQNGNDCRLVCWPQQPIQMVAVAVDFPDIVVDKGQFFGESKPLPLRLYLGGQFYIESTGMVVQNPTPLKIGKNAAGNWSFDSKHLFHKMAVASKLIQPSDAFLPQDIDKLLGKAFQFDVQVYMKKAKNGKSYYTEYIKYVGGLGRGMQTPELPFEPLLIQFNKDNKDEDIKDLRAHVVNTIKRATNYFGSKIEAQINSTRGSNSSSEASGDDNKGVGDSLPAKEVKPAQKAATEVKNAPPVTAEFEDDIPFNRFMSGKLSYVV